MRNLVATFLSIPTVIMILCIILCLPIVIVVLGITMDTRSTVASSNQLVSSSVGELL